MAKAPGPLVLVTVGFAVNVNGPLPVLVTVIVPVLTVLVAGVVVSTGLGAEKPTTACRAVPLSAIGEPVTTSAAPPGAVPVTVRDPVNVPAVVGRNLIRIVLIGAAGTIPVVTFVAERNVTRSFEEAVVPGTPPAEATANRANGPLHPVDLGIY